MSNLLTEAQNDTIDTLFAMATGAINATSGINANNLEKSKYSYSSIINAGSKLIAVFPVLCSRTVSPDTAQMVAKYIEQVACHFFTLALQQANIDTAQSGIEYLQKYHQNLDIGGNGVDTVIATMNNWIDAYKAGKITEGSGIGIEKYNGMGKQDLNLDAMLESDTDLEISSRDMAALMEVMKANENLQFFDTKLNPISINDFTVNEFVDGTYHVSIKPYTLNEAKRNSGGLRKGYRIGVKNKAYDRSTAKQHQDDDDADREYAYTQKKRKWEEEDRNDSRKDRDRTRREHNIDRAQAQYDRQRKQQYEDEDRYNRSADRAQAQYDRQRKQYYEDEDRYNRSVDRAQAQADRQRKQQYEDEDRARQAQEREEAKDRQASEDKYIAKKRGWEQDEHDYKMRSQRDEDYARSHSGRNVSFLKDQEIKKMNDAVPSILVVKFYHTHNGVTSNIPTEFIVGVKSKLVPVTTTEVLRRIMNDNKDGKKFIAFMRTLTGELKASELIFGLSRIQDDVKSCRVKGAYGDTWNLLANRAKAARDQVRRGQRNDFSAITTLVISQYDAEELFREENFDISDPKNALHFMQSYNLMAFAIVDDATESMKILFDNDSKSFEEIAYRMLERETQDGTYKKLINLMAASK